MPEDFHRRRDLFLHEGVLPYSKPSRCSFTPSEPGESIRLSICRDPDDQKFIELAYQSAAAVLITKDKALLKLARKTQKAALFQIMTPEVWVGMRDPK